MDPMNVRGDPIPDLSGFSLFEDLIADGAPCEALLQGRQTEPGDHLTQLVRQSLARHQEAVGQVPFHHHPLVAGQHDAVFPVRLSQQLVVGDFVLVPDVPAEDPHPPGEPSQHHIGKKTDFPIHLPDHRAPILR